MRGLECCICGIFFRLNLLLKLFRWFSFFPHILNKTEEKEFTYFYMTYSLEEPALEQVPFGKCIFINYFSQMFPNGFCVEIVGLIVGEDRNLNKGFLFAFFPILEFE